ncbi:MAG: hypothetical protein PHN42_01010 [Bacilli bacterium]|nr:hypothetical protein [Bacilli bacterium]
MNSFFKNMDENTYIQIFNDDKFASFKEKYQDKNVVENNIEEIVMDMDLLIEGVNTPNDAPYIEMGLIILELNARGFKYSKEYGKYNYLDRINELKEYYHSKGISNQQMLDIIHNYKKVKIK